MRLVALSILAATIAVPLAAHAQASAGISQTPVADCEPMGNIKFVCVQGAPEDLIRIPGSDWVVASSFHGKTNMGIRLVSISHRTSTIVYPSATAKDRLDKKTYDACPGPLPAEDKAALDTHGLALGREKAGLYPLYAVHHGTRESIEVFALNARGKTPALTWVGCVVAPNFVALNAVAALPDGGLIASHFSDTGPGMTESRAKIGAGQINGDVREWHPGKGWTIIPNSQASGANGVEVSKDGKWVYVAGTGSQSVIRLSRGTTPLKRDEIPVGFHTDNLRIGDDGMLYAAGQGDKSSRLVKIDPVTLKVTDLINQPDTAAFGYGTVGIVIGRDIWVGSYRGDRIAIFPTLQ
jgi:DNA-binding beta-propeller fold protein YncE